MSRLKALVNVQSCCRSAPGAAPVSRSVRYLAGICLLLPCVALLAAFMSGQDGHAVDLDAVLQGPSGMHLLGTDALGRDLLARLSEGLRLSVTVGVVVVLCGGLAGISVGMLSGWLGGWADALLMRIADVVLSFPGILLAIALAAMLGPGWITWSWRWSPSAGWVSPASPGCRCSP